MGPNGITRLEASVLLLFFCSRRPEYLSVMRVEMARGVLSKVWFVVADRFHGRQSEVPS